MVKRFTDTEIWTKNWFLELDDKQKLLTKFIFDNCDCAGIYEISWRMLKVFFSNEITREDFQKIKQIRFISDDVIIIEDFIQFQCGVKSINELNPNNNAHKGIIKRLEKYNVVVGAKEGLTSPSDGALCAPQEKEKEKEKETTTTSNQTISSSLLLSSSLEGDALEEPEPSKPEPEVPKPEPEPSAKLYGEYLNVYLDSNQYGKLRAMCASDKLLNELINSFSIKIEVGKERPYTAELPNAHYERLRSYYTYRRKNPTQFGGKNPIIKKTERQLQQQLQDSKTAESPVNCEAWQEFGKKAKRRE